MTSLSDNHITKANDKEIETHNEGIDTENQHNILSPIKQKTLKERNIIEEKKVKIISTHSSFSFNLNVYGKSLFTNLILLISTNVNHNAELIFKWNKIKDKTTVPLHKDTNSRMYILSAEDIGYTIDIQIFSKHNVNNEETAHAQYGPIEFNKEMKNTMELLLSKESLSFNAYAYKGNDNNENIDSTMTHMISFFPNEFVLSDKDNKELERTKYIPFNTIIALNQYYPLKFSITFCTYEYEDTDSSTIKLKSQREYDLIASSKQSREVIYLLFKFHSIEEDMKLNRLFPLINSNSNSVSGSSSEVKDSMLNLIQELSITKEENQFMQRNIKYLEYSNRKISKNLKRLEEDYSMTLETINSIDFYSRNTTSNSRSNSNNHSITNANENDANSINNKSIKAIQYDQSIYEALNADKDQLIKENKALIEQNKALTEELNQYAIKEDQYILLINKNNTEIELIRDSYLDLKSNNTKLIEENKQLTKEVQELINESDKVKQVSEKAKQLENKEYEALKSKLLDILTEKNRIEKEYNTLKQHKEDIANDYQIQSEQLQSLIRTIESKNTIVDQLNAELNSIRTESNQLRIDIQTLEHSLDNSNEAQFNLKSQLSEVTKERDAYEAKNTEMEIELKTNANDKRLIKLSLLTKEDEVKGLSIKLNEALEENKAIKRQYNTAKQELIQLQEYYSRVKDKQQDLNMSTDSFIDIRQREMFEELNQLKREKDETEAYILKLKYNNDNQAIELNKLKALLSQYQH